MLAVFEKWGQYDEHKDASVIPGTVFARFCRETPGLMDKRTVTPTAVDLLFEKSKGDGKVRALSFPRFVDALQRLAVLKWKVEKEYRLGLRAAAAAEGGDGLEPTIAEGKAAPGGAKGGKGAPAPPGKKKKKGGPKSPKRRRSQSPPLSPKRRGRPSTRERAEEAEAINAYRTSRFCTTTLLFR